MNKRLLNPTSLKPLVLATAAAAGVACLSYPTPGRAQTGGLEEVVVVAEKLKGDTQDLPIAVSSFDAAELQQYSIFQVKDLVSFTPGLTATPGPNGGNEGLFFIRGIGQADGNAATDPGVATYLDGVYLGRSTGASLDALDIERVDVLRGPQGTLFGRNTIGGAVNIVTAKPTFDEAGGQLLASVMNRSGYKVQGAGNVPLSDNVALRLSGMSLQQDGWGESVYSSDTFGDFDTDSARAKLRWAATDNVDVLLSVDGMRARGTSLPTVLVAFDGSPSLPHGGATPLAAPFPADMGSERSGDSEDIFSSIDPRNDMDVLGTSLHVDWNLGAVQISSITAWRDLESFTTQDFDGGRYATYDNQMEQDQDQFSQEFLFSGDGFDGRLDWLAGLYYFEESVDYANRINLGHNTNQFPFSWQRLDGRGLQNNQTFQLDVEAWAAFFNVSYRLTDTLTLSVGGRYNDEEKTQAFDFFVDNTDGIFSFIPAPFPGNPSWPNPGYTQLFTPGQITPTLSPRNPFLPPNTPTTYSDSWQEFDPKVALDWQLSDAVLLYTSYAEGFKSGGWNGRPQDIFSPVPTYEPEEVQTVEIGFKSQWNDGRITFNGAYYFSDYTDIQLLVVSPGSGFFETRNAAEAEVQGIELEFSGQLTDALRLRWTGTWIDTEYAELDLRARISGIDEGDSLPLTPEFSTSLGLMYTFSLGGGGAVVARGDYAWRDDVSYGAANGAFEQESAYGLLNLRLTWVSASERWSVAGWVRNATDEDYFSNAQDVVNGLGVAFAGVGRPREYGLDVSYEF